MELNVSICLEIVDGIGEIYFPEALKRDALTSTLSCHSLYLKKNFATAHEAYFLTSNCSYHLSKNQVMKNNILAMFENKRRGDFISFNNFKVPITLPQETLQFKIVNCHGEQIDLSALAVMEIAGVVSNKLQAI